LCAIVQYHLTATVQTLYNDDEVNVLSHRQRYLLYGLIAVLLAACSSASHWNESWQAIQTDLPSAPTPQPFDPTQANAIDESVRVGDLVITLTESSQVMDKTGLLGPAPNYTFWSVSFTIVNLSPTQTIAIHSSNTWMQDAPDGAEAYGLATPTNSSVSDLDGPLAPGQTVQAWLVYEVPVAARELFWIYDDSTTSERAIFQVKAADR
jgi:hypothetical protein